MMREMVFILPLRVKRNNTKLESLNLNIYRNANHFTLNRMKKEFKLIFTERYGEFQGPPIGKCTLEYTIFFPSTRRTDLSNVACIVDKFASDCLVELGYIADDSWDILGGVQFLPGGIDRKNPRAELKLKEI